MKVKKTFTATDLNNSRNYKKVPAAEPKDTTRSDIRKKLIEASGGGNPTQVPNYIKNIIDQTNDTDLAYSKYKEYCVINFWSELPIITA